MLYVTVVSYKNNLNKLTVLLKYVQCLYTLQVNYYYIIFNIISCVKILDILVYNVRTSEL